MDIVINGTRITTVYREARDIQKGDMVIFRGENRCFASQVTADAFQQSRRLVLGGPFVKVDDFRIALGRGQVVSGGHVFEVAVNPESARNA